MDKFVARENIKHFRMLLAGSLDQTDRQRVMALLQEEEAKLTKVSEPVGDPETEPSPSNRPNVID